MVKVFATKPEDEFSILRTHIVEGENQFLRGVLYIFMYSNACACAHTHMHARMHVLTHRCAPTVVLELHMQWGIRDLDEILTFLPSASKC